MNCFLRDLVDNLDDAYASRNLDARHGDRWWRLLDHWWPVVARETRANVPHPITSPSYVAGVVSCVGTLDRCRKLGRIMVDEFVESGREGVFVHLARRPEATGPQDQFVVAIGFTGVERGSR